MDDGVNKTLLLEMLSTLTKLRKKFPYTLLFYILSSDDLMKLLDTFAGATVTFPTQKELLECLSFAAVQKYGGYDKAPKEVLNGLTKKRYLELLSAIEEIN